MLGWGVSEHGVYLDSLIWVLCVYLDALIWVLCVYLDALISILCVYLDALICVQQGVGERIINVHYYYYYYYCPVTLPLTINETLKWLSFLPVLMQESFWG